MATLCNTQIKKYFRDEYAGKFIEGKSIGEQVLVRRLVDGEQLHRTITEVGTVSIIESRMVIQH